MKKRLINIGLGYLCSIIEIPFISIIMVSFFNLTWWQSVIITFMYWTLRASYIADIEELREELDKTINEE